jgi:hypothetical protein
LYVGISSGLDDSHIRFPRFRPPDCPRQRDHERAREREREIDRDRERHTDIIQRQRERARARARERERERERESDIRDICMYRDSETYIESERKKYTLSVR